MNYEIDPFDADATPLHVGCRGLVVDAILSREYSEHFGQQLGTCYWPLGQSTRCDTAFSTAAAATRPDAAASATA